ETDPLARHPALDQRGGHVAADRLLLPGDALHRQEAQQALDGACLIDGQIQVRHVGFPRRLVGRPPLQFMIRTGPSTQRWSVHFLLWGRRMRLLAGGPTRRVRAAARGPGGVRRCGDEVAAEGPQRRAKRLALVPVTAGRRRGGPASSRWWASRRGP